MLTASGLMLHTLGALGMELRRGLARFRCAGEASSHVARYSLRELRRAVRSNRLCQGARAAEGAGPKRRRRMRLLRCLSSFRMHATRATLGFFPLATGWSWRRLDSEGGTTTRRCRTARQNRSARLMGRRHRLRYQRRYRGGIYDLVAQRRRRGRDRAVRIVEFRWPTGLAVQRFVLHRSLRNRIARLIRELSTPTGDLPGRLAVHAIGSRALLSRSTALGAASPSAMGSVRTGSNPNRRPQNRLVLSLGTFLTA